jgi:hypothetical protein
VPLQFNDWDHRCQVARANPPPIVKAETFVRQMGQSFSSPVQLKCDDGHDYAVKSPSDGLATATEQIVARLAAVIASPVPETRLVSISRIFLDDNKATMSKFTEGLAHGLRIVPNCTNKLGIQDQNLPANRARFASLAVLYGWFVGGDQQFFYDKTTKEVWSFDHGFFFPSGPNWTEATLDAHKTVGLDATIAGACAFTKDEVDAAKAPLGTVTEEHIATAVMSPPDNWAITMPMRLKAAAFLASRRQTLRV